MTIAQKKRAARIFAFSILWNCIPSITDEDSDEAAEVLLCLNDYVHHNLQKLKSDGVSDLGRAIEQVKKAK